MGLIPPETLDAIRSRLDITEVAREFIPDIHRAGRHWKARCPFHQEKTASFILNPERQTYHCFGCGVTGDVFSLVMKLEGLSFVEAVEKLAERAGVKIERSQDNSPQEKERLRLKEVLAFARDFYHQYLMSSAAAGPARDYFARRGVSKASMESFGLGYAAGGTDGSLLAAAAKKGFKSDVLIKAGLAAARDGRVRNYFFHRVLFPILDAKGSVVGFGARASGDAQPKYLNSPDSPIFSKGRVLYGLHPALPEIRKKRRALLMEGYMDVIAAHQFGVTTACAPLGTALTLDHVALLKRYASEAIVIFDADGAGIAAAIRGAGLLLEAGVAVRIATVPEGGDPDELLHKSGLEPFNRCLETAVDLPEFRTEIALKTRRKPLSPADKSAIAREVFETISHSPDEVLKDEWMRRLAQRIEVEEGALRRQLEKGSAPRRFKPIAAPVPAGAPLGQADKEILALVLKEPALAGRVLEGDVESSGARRVLAKLVAAGKSPAWGEFVESLLPEDRPAVARILTEDVAYEDPEETLEELLGRRRRVVRFKELEPKILRLAADGKKVDQKLMDEYKGLLVELKGSKR